MPTIERKALGYLVVPEISGATTGCTTIRNLLKHASSATMGCEALKTMYPRFYHGTRSHANESLETASSKAVKGLG